MANMLRDGVIWLAAQQKAFAGTAITYTRGAYSVALMAVAGHTDAEVQDGNGRTRAEWADKDYLVIAAELILNGVVTTPQKGDRITDGTEVREVTPAGGDRHYRPSDQFGIRLRVHTKRVA